MMSKVLLLLTMSFSLMGCDQNIYYNNTGVAKLKLKDNEGAKKDFIQALLLSPGSIENRYNLSLSNILLEQLSDSITELNAIEDFYNDKKIEKSDLSTLFNLYFAQAFVHSLSQNVEKALEYYQKALRIKPDSIDVKKNIELLITAEKKYKYGKNGEKVSQESDEGEDGAGKKGDGDDPKNKESVGQDDKTIEKKNLSKEQIEEILKEIKEQESKVRSKENQNGDVKGKGNDEKSW